MKQQEIQFFWPLTEQIPLDLDYNGCERPKLNVSNDTGITFTTYATAPGQLTITASSFNIDADTTKILTNGKPPLYRRILLSLLGIQWQTRDKEAIK